LGLGRCRLEMECVEGFEVGLRGGVSGVFGEGKGGTRTGVTVGI